MNDCSITHFLQRFHRSTINHAAVRTQTRSVWGDNLIFFRVFQVIFFFLLAFSASLSSSWIDEMITQLKNRRNNSSWKRWCLNTSFSHFQLRWIRDALVCLHARCCSEFHVSFCVFDPQGCKLSRAAPQTSYFYLFVLNTHTHTHTTLKCIHWHKQVQQNLKEITESRCWNSLYWCWCFSQSWNIPSWLLYSSFCPQVLS